MGYLEEQIDLTSKIVRGKIKRPQVERTLAQMEEKYGERCFNSYPVDRKEKPWSKDYLSELELISGSGASSKEFYLYMSEVSDYVYAHKSRKIKVGIAVCVIVVIVLLILLLSSAAHVNRQTSQSHRKTIWGMQI
jgi:hypothetical protein